MERDMLVSYLDSQRKHVLGILDDLTEEQLRKAALPSGWTPRELVHHLATDCERFWFRGTVAGQQEVTDVAGQDGWKVPEDMSGTDVIDLYRREIDLSNAVIATTDIDAALAWWPAGIFGTWRLHSVREVLLHMIVETATHAGHLDAARELIDGRQWMVNND